MKSKVLIVPEEGHEREVVHNLFLYEGITKKLRNIPEGFLSTFETDSPQKLDLFIKEQLMGLPHVSMIRLWDGQNPGEAGS